MDPVFGEGMRSNWSRSENHEDDVPDGPIWTDCSEDGERIACTKGMSRLGTREGTDTRFVS